MRTLLLTLLFPLVASSETFEPIDSSFKSYKDTDYCKGLAKSDAAAASKCITDSMDAWSGLRDLVEAINAARDEDAKRMYEACVKNVEVLGIGALAHVIEPCLHRKLEARLLMKK